MQTTTADLLLDYAERFRDRIDLDSVQSKLGSTDPKDQRQAVLFSVYHLLFSGAVAEANIDHYLARTWDANAPPAVLPGPVQARADKEDRWANFLGWKGTAFGGANNIIGAIAFSVVVLFFFEGFCKAVIGESRLRQGLHKQPGHRSGLDGILRWLCKNGRAFKRSQRPIGLDDVLRWLRKDGETDASQLDTTLFLNRYRNGWHNFGRYAGKNMTCRGVALRKGRPLPMLAPPARDEMLADLLDLFLEVDATY